MPFQPTLFRQAPSGMIARHRPGYARFAAATGYERLDPNAFEWVELRRTPEDYPRLHVAKVQSTRTVIGFDYPLSDGGAERLYLKRALVQGLGRRLRLLFRISKEWREIELARQFAARGVTVPQPVLYAEGWAAERNLPVTYLATRAVPEGFQEARQFFDRQRSYGKEWRALALFTAGLHDRGVLHGDYRADHIWIRGQGAEPAWALIDLDGSRTGRTPSQPERRRALLQLFQSLIKAGLAEPDVRAFLKSYGWDASETRQLYETAVRLDRKE